MFTQQFRGDRNFATGIYFLLTSDDFSAFHRINQDEIWHFYDGSPVGLHIIKEDGAHSYHIVGSDILGGETPQLVVPARCWFAAEVFSENSYALVGCTVAPGFSFDDFELASREELSNKYPEHKTLISRFTRQ